MGPEEDPKAACGWDPPEHCKEKPYREKQAVSSLLRCWSYTKCVLEPPLG